MDHLWKLAAELFVEQIAPTANPVRSLEYDCGACDITAILVKNSDSVDSKPDSEPTKMRPTHDNLMRHLKPGRMTSLADRSSFDLLKKLDDKKTNWQYRRSRTQGCTLFGSKIPDYMIDVEFIGVKKTRLPKKVFLKLIANEKIDCITPFLTRWKSFYVVTKVYKADAIKFRIVVGDRTRVISKNGIQLAFEYTKVNITPQRKMDVFKDEENVEGQLYLETLRQEGRLQNFYASPHKSVVETLQNALDDIDKKAHKGGPLQSPAFDVE
ncbi:uncharacterized protein LOC117115993 [Anneissia japonica]|uniref:uncharacterized protein LOC117115993 n=1 Tax=Anneissia japonica TaxID=1529436 RepID=UPI001425A893|nr:uncharacterized protein LOC117115993 [Anneissia japonica]